jgi:hypothetical protein
MATLGGLSIGLTVLLPFWVGKVERHVRAAEARP